MEVRSPHFPATVAARQTSAAINTAFPPGARAAALARCRAVFLCWLCMAFSLAARASQRYTSDLRTMGQVAFPTDVSPSEVARERTLGGAIGLCAKAAGYEPKELQAELKWDKAQWSRWESGQEGVVWPKLTSLMDYCGNDAPLFWMAYDRGYDLSRLVKRESEIERQNRLLKEENAALRRVLTQGATA